MDKAEFENLLGAVVVRELDGCTGLRNAERLSGGASQETYRLTLTSAEGDRVVCMRRAPGGGVDHDSDVRIAPGLATEAQLMACARDAGVPEPEVYYVLQDADGLGEGFIMEWLEGEALGARIVKIPELDAIRPSLAYACGEILARIHGIDLDATGLR